MPYHAYISEVRVCHTATFVCVDLILFFPPILNLFLGLTMSRCTQIGCTSVFSYFGSFNFPFRRSLVLHTPQKDLSVTVGCQISEATTLRTNSRTLSLESTAFFEGIEHSIQYPKRADRTRGAVFYHAEPMATGDAQLLTILFIHYAHACCPVTIYRSFQLQSKSLPMV